MILTSQILHTNFKQSMIYYLFICLFLSRFPADYPGTHFWHAHVGMQRSDGVFGALVTRQTPVTDPHFSFYDLDLPEHTIFVNDWLNELTLNRFSHHHQAGGDNKPSSMLIQGKYRPNFINLRSGNYCINGCHHRNYQLQITRMHNSCGHSCSTLNSYLESQSILFMCIYFTSS